MDSITLKNKLEELKTEYNKGQAVLRETNEKMLRIEGAIIKLQEIIKEISNENQNSNIKDLGGNKLEETLQN